MRINVRALVPAVLLLATACLGVAQSRMPRNSYLEMRVSSTAELIRHVRTNSVVMDRYRRHFAMTSEEIISYLSTLRVTRTQKDGVFTVYGVPRRTGDFHSNLRMLKKGELIFVEPDGTPVLQLICGNPLLLGPKKPTTPNPVVTTTGEVEGPHEVAPEATPSPSPAQPAPEVPPVGDVPTPEYPPSRGSSPVPLLLGLAGSIGFFIMTGGNDCPPVPEPVSMLVLGGGVALMAARRRMKKKSV